MRDSKLLVIIFLLFLLLASIGGLLFLYKQNNDIKAAKEATVKIVVAAKDIPQNQKIVKEDLKIISVPKNSVQFDILLEREVIGKYAAVAIYKEEPIRGEKISKLIEKRDINSTAKQAKQDLYNIATKHFQNPNFTLKGGDIIDIVGVWGEDENPTVKYIAKSIPLHGFLFRGLLEENAVKEVTKKLIDPKTKKEVETTTFAYADEMLLDTNAPVITAIIEAHNKGHQLWMVQSGAESREELLKSIATPAAIVTAYKPTKRKKRSTSSSNYPKASIAYGTGGEKVTSWK